MRLAGFLIAAALSLAAAPAGAKDLVFRPEVFFAGRTSGEGTLRVLFAAPRTLRVQSRGRVLPDGTLLIVQRIAQEGEAPRTRRWRLGPVAHGRYEGTLTDAEGPVQATVSGPALDLRYTMKGNRLLIRQRLVLQPDGRTVQNRLTASALGLPIARVEETIRKKR